MRRHRYALPYEPETVVVTGTVQRALAYGPPGFGETPDEDAKKVFYSLQLAAPICVLGGDDSDQPAEGSIRQLQIAFINLPLDRSLPGHQVRIISTLFHAMSGHHHTKVLISPENRAAVSHHKHALNAIVIRSFSPARGGSNLNTQPYECGTSTSTAMPVWSACAYSCAVMGNVR
jgi:Domain of unknown function (DUF4431)